MLQTCRACNKDQYKARAYEWNCRATPDWIVNYNTPTEIGGALFHGIHYPSGFLYSFR